MAERLIYHLCRAEDWEAAKAAGVYEGSAQDRADGFMHFSTKDQIVESAARHRAGEEGLLLLTVRGDALGAALKWELSPSRGESFPHLYGPLSLAAVVRVDPLPLGPDGRHVFPPLA